MIDSERERASDRMWHRYTVREEENQRECDKNTQWERNKIKLREREIVSERVCERDLRVCLKCGRVYLESRLSLSTRRQNSDVTKSLFPSTLFLIPQSGVHFINVLQAAFAHADPESTKRQSRCQSFLRFQDLHVQKLLTESCWNLHKWSISPIFYQQLLQTQIPKPQKDTDDTTVNLRFWNLRA